MLFKLMLFVIIVQEIIQVSTAKWEILLPNRVMDKQITCQIFNVKIIHTQTRTILYGGTTPTSHGAINQGLAKPPQQFPQQEKKLTLEDMFMQYIQKTDVAIQNNSASIRNLEVQIG